MRWTKIPFAGPTTATLRILSLFKIIDLMLYQSLRPRLVCDSPYPCRFPPEDPVGNTRLSSALRYINKTEGNPVSILFPDLNSSCNSN